MKYIVIELQTMQDGSVANIVTTKDTRNEAESTFHSILAAAAISNLPCHSATMLTSDGFLLATEKYEHEGTVVQTEEAE